MEESMVDRKWLTAISMTGVAMATAVGSAWGASAHISADPAAIAAKEAGAAELGAKEAGVVELAAKDGGAFEFAKVSLELAKEAGASELAKETGALELAKEAGVSDFATTR
jgi:hypothetical protein